MSVWLEGEEECQSGYRMGGACRSGYNGACPSGVLLCSVLPISLPHSGFAASQSAGLVLVAWLVRSDIRSDTRTCRLIS